MTTKAYRIKTELHGCVSKTLYIVRDAKGKVSCFDKNETPHSFSYLSDNGAELRFALEDARDSTDAKRALISGGFTSNTYAIL